MAVKKILAIETSGDLCSVALSLDQNKFDERNILLKHIHSEKLIPMIEELLKSNNIEAKDLDCLSVSIGPGSFTGLRIGLTAAKGIAFASNIPIVPVPTFDALSFEISEYIPENEMFCIINNANIEECYFAKYQKSHNGVNKLVESCILLKAELDEKIDNCKLLFGNLKALPEIRNISSPRAISLAKWTYLFGEDLLTYDYDYLEPKYLKNFKVRNQK
ncbi:MAG: tRNA (adenosine(37)-N6)-threonylcarbamoyltransferase complex dimerization subunit type 1 TsaB [Ignavibacteriae bacterium]|nr:tRNA (adenosine(37)-N6)-threonylcarbamoyltransferase complex dimerization subunit type 1 TsaB [Ignavibacteriota bacterium]MCB9209032.1 tRNA (adenosine(37)-N6)-threonylcarbamoyltransferase complex dimerization subunit type 1 TsaB [Ignavibacteriales bacterium]MCB9218046.1 tRNA (adenosine(37)-N6)-threonylcarbamoyltransferase complex dimerization subunit type 1 TsaB [Ignavibacteriales bacterium]MCB9260435.1 tRNA (adenosine(37)-N6)-threonylcarbamoyltransferase complex dimerization subunit type 1 T